MRRKYIPTHPRPNPNKHGADLNSSYLCCWCLVFPRVMTAMISVPIIGALIYALLQPEYLNIYEEISVLWQLLVCFLTLSFGVWKYSSILVLLLKWSVLINLVSFGVVYYFTDDTGDHEKAVVFASICIVWFMSVHFLHVYQEKKLQEMKKEFSGEEQKSDIENSLTPNQEQN